MKRKLASLEGHFAGELAAARMETDLLVRRHKAYNKTLLRKRDIAHLAALERSRTASRMAPARSRQKLKVSVSVSFLYCNYSTHFPYRYLSSKQTHSLNLNKQVRELDILTAKKHNYVDGCHGEGGRYRLIGKSIEVIVGDYANDNQQSTC